MPELGCGIAVAAAHRKQNPVNQWAVFMLRGIRGKMHELSDKCRINPCLDEIKVGAATGVFWKVIVKFVPKGHHDNSPAFQRRVKVRIA